MRMDGGPVGRSCPRLYLLIEARCRVMLYWIQRGQLGSISTSKCAAWECYDLSNYQVYF